MNYPALLSFFCGLISLSLEILWVRMYGFAMMSTPVAFGFVLMAYLSGIALGAWQGGVACRTAPSESALWKQVTVVLLASALLTLAIPSAFVWIQGQWWRNPVVDFALIAVSASVLAYVFPIAHHLGVGLKNTKQGKHFSWIYTSNVMGAALGPLATGYVLLEYFTLQQAFLALATLQLCAFGLSFSSQNYNLSRIPVLLTSALLMSTLLWTSNAFDPHFMVKRLSKNNLIAYQVVENRSGIITVFREKDTDIVDDVVYGGNVYDGRTNLSMENNTNGLHRPLLLAALQPRPRRVLMIGLSIGSWLTLVNSFPGVEQIDAVEINAGYLQAIEAYPVQARALRDPRVNLVIDDARRWLRAHPGKIYDLVIMNTTWHWRANSGFLLSRDFLMLIKEHMATDAVMAFNATGSPDAFFTAAQVFHHAYRYDNFIYAAGFDFRSRKESIQARKTYSQMNLEGLEPFRGREDLINLFLGRSFHTIEQEERNAGRPLEIITDTNGLTEYKYGYTLGKLY